MATTTAPQRNVIKVGETRLVVVDFTDKLESGELLTGTPVVTERTTTDLTLASKTVNSAALTINNRSVAIGQAVQFLVSGQLAATGSYTIKVQCGTNSTPAQTLICDVVVVVEA